MIMYTISSIPTLIVATIATIAVTYFVQDAIRDPNRFVASKTAIVGLVFGFLCYKFFVTMVQYIPLEIFNPVQEQSSYSGMTKRAIYSLVCIYSITLAGISITGVVKMFFSMLGVIMGYPDIFLWISSYLPFGISSSSIIDKPEKSRAITLYQEQNNSKYNNTVAEKPAVWDKFRPKLFSLEITYKDKAKFAEGAVPAGVGIGIVNKKAAFFGSLVTGYTNIVTNRVTDTMQEIALSERDRLRYKQANAKLERDFANYVTQNNARVLALETQNNKTFWQKLGITKQQP